MSKQDTIIQKIIYSNFFLYLCLYLLPIPLLQNLIFDYPYRFHDILGRGFFVKGFLGIFALMYFWGMFYTMTLDESESLNKHFWTHLYVWVFAIGFYASSKFLGL